MKEFSKRLSCRKLDFFGTDFSKNSLTNNRSLKDDLWQFSVRGDWIWCSANPSFHLYLVSPRFKLIQIGTEPKLECWLLWFLPGVPVPSAAVFVSVDMETNWFKTDIFLFLLIRKRSHICLGNWERRSFTWWLQLWWLYIKHVHLIHRLY